MAANTLKADIVVIGAGGAGMAAAVQAAEKGAKVVLLETRHAPGGNSAMANGFFGAESPAQKRFGINAPRDPLFKAHMDFTHWTVEPRIVRAYVDMAGDTVGWLEKKGLKIQQVTTLNPQFKIHTFHRVLGATIIKIFVKECEKLGIKTVYNTAVKKLLTNAKGKVTGVQATTKDGEHTVNAKRGIITTGGYGANKKLLKKFCPTWTDEIIYLGLKELTGDGLTMATDAGADTASLGILHYWGGRYNGPRLVNRVNRRPDMLWINRNGQRYCDETVVLDMGLRGNVVDRQPGKVSYTLFDDKMKRHIVSENDPGAPSVEKWEDLKDISKDLSSTADRFYGFTEERTNFRELDNMLKMGVEKGDFKIADTLDEIAKWMGVKPAALKTTVDEYNSFCDKGHDALFAKDKEYLVPVRKPPFYAMRTFSHFPDTIGGIRANERMEVLDKAGNPIPGLYAAGVCVGGWQSDTYCFILTGSMMGFALNSGRIAGTNAAKAVTG